MDAPRAGRFFEDAWRGRCGYAVVEDAALPGIEVLAACGEVPVLLLPAAWGDDPALREVLFAAAATLLYRERYGDEPTASAIANHPRLARAMGADTYEDAAD